MQNPPPPLSLKKPTPFPSPTLSTHNVDLWLEQALPGTSWALTAPDLDDLSFFIPWLRCRRWLQNQSPQRPVDVIILPHTKALKGYHQRHHSAHSPLWCWPSIDGWTEHSGYRPLGELKWRMSTLFQLLHQKNPLTILTTYTALHETTWHPKLLSSYTLTLTPGSLYPRDVLEEKLHELGYMLTTGEVDGYGEFTLRPGTCDIFPPGYPHPLRLDFNGSGELLQSLRQYSAHSGRSFDELSGATLLPMSELVFPKTLKDTYSSALHKLFLEQQVERHERSALLDSLHRGEFFSGCDRYAFFLRSLLSDQPHGTLHHYLKASENLPWLWHTLSSEDSKQHLEQSNQASFKSYTWEHSHNLTTLPPTHYRVAALDNSSITSVHLDRDGWGTMKGHLILRELLSSPLQQLKSREHKKSKGQIHKGPASSGAGPELVKSEILEILRKKDSAEHTSILIYDHPWHLKELEELCQHLSIPQPQKLTHAFLSPEMWQVLQKEGGVYVGAGHLLKDYQIADDHLHFIPAAWLLTSSQKPASSKEHQKEWQDYLKSLSDIAPGDLVVHQNHGVGRYEGLVPISSHNVEVECLKIQYAKGDRIYLPVDNIALLQKHSSPASDSSPSASLDSLSRKGKGAWQKRHTRIKRSLGSMAKEILRTQSRRELKHWPPYQTPPPPEYERFIEEFPHIETADQQRFSQDLEEDFTDTKAMDRLLIGDVGFGKTEMAMRAAIRTVLEGYQVMMLCPTTVLCYQHSRTFQKRFSGFDITQASVSRFTSTKNLKVIQQEFSEGKISILIGTHKLLGKGFQPHKLGLVIVDEEQRFGVSHKEKIKALRCEAGVLALSATPIPRTMHMSMVGLRDISLLTTPPAGRLAVKNKHISWNEHLIKEAIEHELRRGGQVFFVHNRVQDLESYVQKLRELLPEQEVRMAHGSMDEASMEQVLMDFLRGNFSILVCTTIMESGIDMPNVNTILINNASRYGLSQLYQLRGRVGRSGIQAYAYLITKPKNELTDVARRRLQVMMNHQELGSGFSIASYDMDLRGVGDLLGEDQSGHLATVGVEMYTQMLSEALSQAKGELAHPQAPPCQLHLASSYGLPLSYIKKDRDRLKVYKKLFSLKSSEELADFALETEDLYGDFPQEVKVLFEVALLQIYLRKFSARSLKETAQGLFLIEITKLPKSLLPPLLAKLSEEPEVFSFDHSERLRVDLRTKKTSVSLRDLRRELQSIIHSRAQKSLTTT